MDLTLHSDELPAYSPTAPSPSYSIDPICGEQRLQLSPRSRSLRPPPTSTFVRKSGKTSVVLYEQEENVHTPSYGRLANITGSICLDESENVTGVTVQVLGKLQSTGSSASSHTIQLLKDSYTLWPPTQATSSSVCPSQLPFSILLPSTYRDGGTDAPLPPTYHHQGLGGPFVIRVYYQIHVSITRIRLQKLDLWPKHKLIVIPFTYNPRTRSHRPIPSPPCLLSSVKTSPEEWYQTVTSLTTGPNSTDDPLACHLFLPAGRIFGLHDAIPFHIQLSGSICMLQKAFGASQTLGRVLSADSTVTIPDQPTTHWDQPAFRVRIMRQHTVKHRGEFPSRNVILGEGTVVPRPPDLSSYCCSTGISCRDGHLDWEGEVRVKSDITTGSWVAGNVEVNDFIVLNWTAPSKCSAVKNMQVTVPIRLVTDSFVDAAEELDMHHFAQ